ncbi:class I SAM-dependent methyltransferase [Candidatus Pelagibacter sp.]|nr:class I SAM-dependent methyltransferase [Candidatus Pelagibacter sp.]
MEKIEYRNHYNLEKNYWWFKGQREIILSLIEKYLKKSKKNNILDAGCGAGYNILKLKKYGNVLGIDYSKEAIIFSKKRGVKNIKKMNLNKISLNKKFNLILCSGVIYHKDIKINKVLNSFKHLLKKDGLIIITTPAISFLQKKIFLTNHDKTMHTGKRYYLSEISNIIAKNKFKIIHKSYFSFFLLVPIIFFRILINFKNFFFKRKIESDLFKLPNFLNSLLLKIMLLEKKIILKLKLPIGLHLIIVAKK